MSPLGHASSPHGAQRRHGADGSLQNSLLVLCTSWPCPFPAAEESTATILQTVLRCFAPRWLGPDPPQAGEAAQEGTWNALFASEGVSGEWEAALAKSEKVPRCFSVSLSSILHLKGG